MQHWGGGAWSGAYSWPWPGVIWLLAVVLFWAGLIALLVWAVRSSAGPRRGGDTALEVLRRRLAAGEITEEEYERIRRLL
jgi:putative membrane protein